MTALTPEAMRAALQSMAHLPACREWPADFDTVMADPVRMRLVRMQATFRARIAPPPAARPAAARPIPLPPPCFDRKRAAAGDRDD